MTGALDVWKDVEQRSEEWNQLRLGTLTASSVGELITPARVAPASNEKVRGLVYRVAAERVSGRADLGYQTRDMMRGVLDEPLAIAEYEAVTGSRVEACGYMVRNVDGARLGYSPDGLIGNVGLVECKSRNPREQMRVFIEDAIPPGNLAQLYAGLWVSGREWIDYVSYCGGLPLYIKRVRPDTRWFETISVVVERFEGEVRARVEAYDKAAGGKPATEYVDHFADEIEVW